MTLSERVAYLKGLCEGMKLDTTDGHGKVLGVIVDILEDMALEVEELGENALDLGDEIDAISDDLSDVEEIIYGDDEDDCCCCDDEDDGDCCCCGEDDECGEPVFYEIKCPNCNNEITVDEDVVMLGGIECPNCGEKLEFEFDEDEEEDDED